MAFITSASTADDRLITGSTSEIGFEELVLDSQICVDALKLKRGVDQNNIFLLGHSEGALIAMLLAQKNNLAGIALVSPAGRPLDIIIEDQLEHALSSAGYNQAQITAQISEIQESIRYAKENKPLTAKAPLPFLFGYKSARWIREHLSNPPSKVAPTVKCPVAIFFGDKDFQLDVEKDGRALAKSLILGGNDKVVFYPLENVDHLMRVEPGVSTPIRYYDMSRPISEKFLQSLANWIVLTIKSKNKTYI
ncbi:MAG: alpha/beta hydrolase [Candidatus Nitrosopolaris sp.]